MMVDDVAPRAGGRGLKSIFTACALGLISRPPRRGAWIEIIQRSGTSSGAPVAPRAGGRGLKSVSADGRNFGTGSPPAQGGVD